MTHAEDPAPRPVAVLAGGLGGVVAAGLEVLWISGSLAPSVADVLLGWAVATLFHAPIAAVIGAGVRRPLQAVAAGAMASAGLAALGHGEWPAGAVLLLLALGAARLAPGWGLGALIGLGVAVGVPRGGQGAPGPRVVLVTVEGLRADAWPAMREASELAVHGRRLLGIAPSPDREAALDAVLVGHMPWSVGGVPLAVRASRDGCATGAFVSARLEPRSGFGVVDDALAAWPLLPRVAAGALVGAPTRERRPAWETAAAAERWLSRQSGCALAWVHLADPLPPLEPPPPWDARFYAGSDPSAPGHPGLPRVLEAAFPGVRDPAWVRAQYEGEVGVADEAIGRLAGLVGDDGRVAVVGLGGLSLETLEQEFAPSTLEVAVALHGEAPLLHPVVSLADVYGWLADDPVDARPWAMRGKDWGVRAADAWRLSVDGEVRETYPVEDLGDRARRALLLDLEQQRMEAARGE